MEIFWNSCRATPSGLVAVHGEALLAAPLPALALPGYGLFILIEARK